MSDFTYTFDELLEQPLSTLPKADLESLLTHRETGIYLVHGGETIHEPDADSVYVSKPRIREMRHGLGVNDEYTELSFTVSTVVSSEAITAPTEDVGPGGMNPTLSDEEPRSAEDVIEDDAEDADGGVKMEEKHVLTDDGIEVREVPVEADETEGDE